MADEGAAEDDSAPPAGAEFQFLGAEERRRAGDTQALAPATEEQAAAQADDLNDEGLLQQRREEQQQQQEGQEDGAVAMEEDEKEEQGEEGEEGQQRSAVMRGALPKNWGGRQSKGKVAGEEKEGEEEGAEGGKEERPSAEGLLRRDQVGSVLIVNGMRCAGMHSNPCWAKYGNMLSAYHPVRRPKRFVLCSSKAVLAAQYRCGLTLRSSGEPHEVPRVLAAGSTDSRFGSCVVRLWWHKIMAHLHHSVERPAH